LKGGGGKGVSEEWSGFGRKTFLGGVYRWLLMETKLSFYHLLIFYIIERIRTGIRKYKAGQTCVQEELKPWFSKYVDFPYNSSNQTLLYFYTFILLYFYTFILSSLILLYFYTIFACFCWFCYLARSANCVCALRIWLSLAH